MKIKDFNVLINIRKHCFKKGKLKVEKIFFNYKLFSLIKKNLISKTTFKNLNTNIYIYMNKMYMHTIKF